jgi:glycosyltransferase involved in cell wall biosynthesis
VEAVVRGMNPRRSSLLVVAHLMWFTSSCTSPTDMSTGPSVVSTALQSPTAARFPTFGTRPMRILLYTTSPRSAIGGMEVVFASLADGLRARGHRVDVVYEGEDFTRVPGARGDTWTVPMARPRTWKKLPKPVSVGECLRTTQQIARMLAKVRPDIVNVHYVDTTAAYFQFLRAVFGYRLVLTAHGSDLLQPFTSVQRLAAPWVLRRADAVLTVSEALTRRAADFGVEACTVPNGVDYDYWSALPRSDSGRPVVVTVGRLHPVKGQDVLVEAFARVAASLPDAELHLIGDGEEHAALEELVWKRDIERQVRFLGRLERDEVRDALAQASLFVLPSRSEGLPLALLEAMAVGVPVVATDVGGVSEVIRNDTEGVLVPPEDPAALARAVSTTLSDPDRRRSLSQNGRERARSFALSRTLGSYEAVFVDLVAKRSQASIPEDPDSAGPATSPSRIVQDDVAA